MDNEIKLNFDIHPKSYSPEHYWKWEGSYDEDPAELFQNTKIIPNSKARMRRGSVQFSNVFSFQKSQIKVTSPRWKTILIKK